MSADGQTITVTTPTSVSYNVTYTYNGTTYVKNFGENEVYAYTATKATDTPVADVPVAGTPVVNAAESRTGVVTGTAVFTDPKGTQLTYAVTTNPTKGAVTEFDTHTGEFTYTPAANASATDAFTVTATNGTHTATETITVPARDVQNSGIAGTWTIASMTADLLDGSGPAPQPVTGTIAVVKAGDTYTATMTGTNTDTGETDTQPLGT